eukprot:scaffold252190_cov18-Prasinocladus_malaysianus.AAC.1
MPFVGFKLPLSLDLKCCDLCLLIGLPNNQGDRHIRGGLCGAALPRGQHLGIYAGPDGQPIALWPGVQHGAARQPDRPASEPVTISGQRSIPRRAWPKRIVRSLACLISTDHSQIYRECMCLC